MNLSGQISIIMPSYQQRAFLEEAACSVLEQEGVGLELLIMDPDQLMVHENFLRRCVRNMANNLMRLLPRPGNMSTGWACEEKGPCI